MFLLLFLSFYFRTCLYRSSQIWCRISTAILLFTSKVSSACFLLINFFYWNSNAVGTAVKFKCFWGISLFRPIPATFLQSRTILCSPAVRHLLWWIHLNVFHTFRSVWAAGFSDDGTCWEVDHDSSTQVGLLPRQLWRRAEGSNTPEKDQVCADAGGSRYHSIIGV